MINGGKETFTNHFESLEEAYIWLKPTDAEQIKERWHLLMFYALRDQFMKWPNSIPRVGYTDILNPEDHEIKDLYIQKVDHFDDPLPLL